MVLEQLSLAGVPLSELRRPFERYVASGEVNRRVADPGAVLGMVEEAFADGRRDHLDGLTVEYDDWWFNLRPSNTEPLLRLNVEAGDVAACQQRTNEVLAIVGGEAD
jgi:phosphomannomutase